MIEDFKKYYDEKYNFYNKYNLLLTINIEDYTNKEYILNDTLFIIDDDIEYEYATLIIREKDLSIYLIQHKFEMFYIVLDNSKIIDKI